MKKHKFNYEYITTSEGLERVKGWLDRCSFFVFDVETGGLNVFNDELVMLQIGDDTKQWLIDCRVLDPRSLGPYFAAPEILKIGQNLKFDIKFVKHNYNWDVVNIADTMIIEQVIRCGLRLRASMEILALYYLRLQLDKDKDLRLSFSTTKPGHFSRRQLEYAAGDCVYPLFILQKQKQVIRERKLTATINLEHKVLPVLAKAELAGMRMDKHSWLKLYQTSIKKRDQAEKQLDQFFGTENYSQDDFFGGTEKKKDINYGSPDQILRLLQLRKYNVESTDKNALILAYIEKRLPKEFVQAMLLFRMYNTRISRYGLNVLKAIESTTGHIHTEFLQTTTATGRLSSGRETGEEFGVKTQVSSAEAKRINFQNLPRLNEFRTCFIADEGYKLVVLDYSAIEPRILAQQSADPMYVKTFQDGLDIYQEIGQEIYHEEVSKKPGRPSELRDKAKIGVLGTSYGTGRPKFFERMRVDLNFNKETGLLNDPIVQVTREEADELWYGIFETCPVIRLSLDESSTLANPRASTRKFYDHRLAEESRDKVYDSLKKLFAEDERLDDEQAETLANTFADNRAYISYSESLGGRKRFYRVSHATWYTDGRNQPIQASASDIIKTAMVLIDARIQKEGHDAVIINQIHDELLVKVREDQADAVEKYMRELMIEAGEKFLPSIPCKVDGGVCDKWQK